MNIIMTWMRNFLEVFHPPQYRVTFTTTGFMGNRYIAGEYSTNAPKRAMKIHRGSISNVCFAENYDKLERHYECSIKGGVISYSSKVEKIDMFTDLELLTSLVYREERK